MDVSIVIVNYNTHKVLEKCLESIFKFTAGISFEVIVIDNNSPDRNIELLNAKFSEVKFYFRNVNDGFGAGCNFGTEKSNGKYLVFVNPDILLLDNAFLVLYNFIEQHNNVAVCTGLHTDSEGNLQYCYNNFPNVIWELQEAFNIGKENTLRKLLNRAEIIDGKPFEIDWALGALLFIKKNIFDEVKGFDKNYFLYSEDNDLQLRIKKLGYKIFCLPTVRVKHSYGSSVESLEGQNTYTYHMNRSRMLYMYKYFGIIERNFVRIIFIFSYLLHIIYLPFNKSKKSIKQITLNRYLCAVSVLCKSYKGLLN